MLISIALIFIFGIVLSNLTKKLHLPPLLGMLIAGIILGPFVFDVIDYKVINIAPDIKRTALLIILTRAGLKLDLQELKSSGKSALFLSFLPALLEVMAITLIAPFFFNITYLEACLIGSVIAAVSPAVIVPKMLMLMDKGYNKVKNIPQMIMAASSIDDVFVIILFYSLLSLLNGEGFNILSFVNIPVSIFLGFIIGIVVGRVLNFLFTITKLDSIIQTLLVISVGFALFTIEDNLNSIISFSSLIAVMSIGISINQINKDLSLKLGVIYSKLWIIAEILLFVLVGISLDLDYALAAGLGAFIILIFGLIARSAGVLISLIESKLNNSEKMFVVFSYLPKATVQAAIGSIALNEGLAVGEATLTLAVLAILLTAPLGSLLIDISYKRCLKIKGE